MPGALLRVSTSVAQPSPATFGSCAKPGSLKHAPTHSGVCTRSDRKDWCRSTSGLPNTGCSGPAASTSSNSLSRKETRLMSTSDQRHGKGQVERDGDRAMVEFERIWMRGSTLSGRSWQLAKASSAGSPPPGSTWHQAVRSTSTSAMTAWSAARSSSCRRTACSSSTTASRVSPTRSCDSSSRISAARRDYASATGSSGRSGRRLRRRLARPPRPSGCSTRRTQSGRLDGRINAMLPLYA